MAFHTEGLQQAIEIAGSQDALGLRIGRSQQAISFYTRSDDIPLRVARKIQEATGVPLSKLIPEFAEAEATDNSVSAA